MQPNIHLLAVLVPVISSGVAGRASLEKNQAHDDLEDVVARVDVAIDYAMDAVR